MTRNYEMVYVINPELGEEGVTALRDQIQDLVAKAGTVAAVEEWGRKRLAYEIDDLKEGYYVVTTFDAEPASIEELERVLRIRDGLLRFLIVKTDE